MGSLFRFNPNGFHRFPPTSGGAYTGPRRQVHERVRRQAAVTKHPENHIPPALGFPRDIVKPLTRSDHPGRSSRRG